MIGVVATASLITATLAGCGGSAHPAAARHANPTAPSLIPPSPTSAYLDAAVAASTAANRQVADQTAAALLKAYDPPPGAHAESTGPATLTGQPPGPGADWVEHTGWWVVDSGQSSVDRLLRAEVTKDLPDPDPASGDMATSNGPNGGDTYSSEEFLTVDAAALGAEDLSAEAGPAAGGKTELRVDVIVDYLPGRTAAETVSGVGSVTVTAYASQPHPPGPLPIPGESVQVTGQAEVSSLAAAINAAPTAGDGPRSCPQFRTIRGLWLDFHPVRTGTADYWVDISTGGCDGTSVTADGVLQPNLNGPSTGRILRILGLTWDVTSTPMF